MSESTPPAERNLPARLASFNVEAPGLRHWSEADLIEALAALNVSTDRAAFATAAAQVDTCGDLELRYVEGASSSGEDERTFIWLATRELWERWTSDLWPVDRLGRMLSYLIDAEYAAAWADNFTSPRADAVLDAIDATLARHDEGEPRRLAFQEIVDAAGMVPGQWETLLFDSLTEWSEVGDKKLAERGARLLAERVGRGHADAYLAAALIAARNWAGAAEHALAVPPEAELDAGFSEVTAHLCVVANDAARGAHWLNRANRQRKTTMGEMTLANEAVRTYLASRRESGSTNGDAEIPDDVRRAAKQAAAQATYFASMDFTNFKA